MIFWSNHVVQGYQLRCSYVAYPVSGVVFLSRKDPRLRVVLSESRTEIGHTTIFFFLLFFLFKKMANALGPNWYILLGLCRL